MPKEKLSNFVLADIGNVHFWKVAFFYYLVFLCHFAAMSYKPVANFKNFLATLYLQNVYLYSIKVSLSSLFKLLIEPHCNCSDPLVVEELHTQTFFCSADRYIHCRELRLATLESPSSVEYEIQTIFFVFFTGSYRG